MAQTIENVLTGVGVLSIKYPVGGAYVEVGYTEDGYILTYTAEEVDIRVEEETFPIYRVIDSEDLTLVCNMAESSLYNIDKAIAGSVLAGQVITIDGGLNKEMGIKLVETNPQGFNRTIIINLATATASVAMQYRKAEKTIVPLTIKALKGASDVCTITDSTS
jgi:hypothetical protein